MYLEKHASIVLLLQTTLHVLSFVGLRLLCSKFYLLFLPEFPKIFTYYSFFILVSSLLFQTYSHLVSVASHNLTALLEYLNVLLEYIDLSPPFQPALV